MSGQRIRTLMLGRCMSAETTGRVGGQYVLVLRVEGPAPSTAELRQCTGKRFRLQTAQEDSSA